MKIEFIDNVPHIKPETQKEEDQLFNWYEKQGQKRVDSVICFEWLPRAKEKSSDENSNCNKPLVSGSASRELVECADCGFRHYKDVRIEKRKNGWTTHHCPKCKSESTCKV